MNLPKVRHLASVRPGPGEKDVEPGDLRFAPNCVDLAYVRVLVARARKQQASREKVGTLLAGSIRGLVQFVIKDDELFLLCRDETSEYRYQVTLPQVR